MGKLSENFYPGIVTETKMVSGKFCSSHNQKFSTDKKYFRDQKSGTDVRFYISNFFLIAIYWSLSSFLILTATMGTVLANIHKNKVSNKIENKLENKISEQSCIDVVCDVSRKYFWIADNSVPDVFNQYPAIFQRTLSETVKVENNSNYNNLNQPQNEAKVEGEKPNNSSQNINKPQLNRTQIDKPKIDKPKLNPEKTNPEQNNPEKIKPKKQEKQIKLSLPDIVFLVVANNTDIKNAYLDRIAQKQDLAVAEDKFVPNLTPTFSLLLNRLGESDSNSEGTAEAQVQVTIPTGATLDFNWTGNAQILDGNNLSAGTNDDFFRQSFQFDLKQPILKGAGIKLNRASINIARLGEQANIINLKSTLIDTITSSITAYRSLLEAQERVEIERLALKNAQESLEVTQALIDAGRQAPVDIIQNQANIASRRVALLDAENQLESRKVALLTILDIDKSTNITADKIPEVTSTVLNLDKLRQTALANRPSYLISKINVSQNELQLLQAKDQRRWDLSLTATLRNETDRESDARAGLSLSRTIGDLSLKQQFEQARVNLRKSENSLQDNLATLDLELQDRVRDVNLSFSQLELARDATRLSERQLEIEQEKQRLGRPTTILDLISLQEELAQRRVGELNATISYLNALTNLDQFLGTTLQTWQINIKD